MEPAEIIASVNRENEELQKQNHQLQDQLSKAHTLNNTYYQELQAQAFQLYVANEELTNSSHYICFLQSYIAHVEDQSDQARRACKETTEYYEREIAAGRWSGHQWSQEAARLSSSARNLHHSAFANFKASNTSDEQKKDLIQKIMEIELTVALKETEKINLKQTLEKNKARLKQVCITSSKIIKDRDDLNRKLAEANVVLRSKAGKNTRALRKAKDERESLQKEIKNAEEELKKCQETEEQLNKAIEREGQLERECQRSHAKAEDLRLSNDFYKREDASQTQTITNLRRLVAELQKTERNEGYTKAIANHKAEIAQLVANKTRLENELQKQEKTTKNALAKIIELKKKANEAEKEAATYKGHALAAKHSLLVTLSDTKLEVAIEIVDHVFEELKDLTSKKKAELAIQSINGYLEQQSKTVEDYATNVASNSAEVQEVVQALGDRTPKISEPDNIKTFIGQVRELQHTLKVEAKQRKTKLNV